MRHGVSSAFFPSFVAAEELKKKHDFPYVHAGVAKPGQMRRT